MTLLEGVTVRRILAGLGVAVLLVLVGVTPASAAEPPPPPVDSAKTLPSTAVRGLTSAGGLGDANIRVSAYLLQQLKAANAAKNGATGAAAAVASSVPVAPPRPVTVGGAGSALTAAFMGGWMITDGTLAMYGAITGDEPMGAACQQPDWAQATLGVIYPLSMPDCSATVIDPNPDLPEAGTLTYGASGITVLGYRHRNSYTYLYQCMISGAPLPAGYIYQSQMRPTNNPDAWTNIGQQVSSVGGNTYCSSTSTVYGSDPYPNATHWSTTDLDTIKVYRVIRQSDSAVVATQTLEKGDPDREIGCNLSWPDGTTTRGVGGTYRHGAGLPLGLYEAACQEAFVSKPGAGPDLLPSEISLDETLPGGTPSEISTTTVPEFDPNEKKGFAQGNGRGLVLEKVVNDQRLSCMTWEAECEGWWAATESGTITTPTPYRCSFGGAAVALAECGIYRHTFDTRTSTPTITDPVTGDSVPWSSTATNPGTIVETVTGGGACGAGWSWNPVDWVLNPTKCAFIPSTQSLKTAQTTMATAWAPTIFGQLPPLVLEVFQPPEGLSGCEGPHIYMPFSNFHSGWVDVSWYPLNACSEPMSGIAAFARVIGSAILIYLTALGMIRRISAAINAPGLGTAAAA